MGKGKLCECGCGQIVKEGNIWINHHYRSWHHSEKTKKKIGKRNSLNLDEKYIKKAFVEQDKTTIEIAKELNTCDWVILRRLKKMGVDTKHKFTKKGKEIVSRASRKHFLENNPMESEGVRLKIGKKTKERWANKDYKKRVSKNISLAMTGNPKARWKKTENTKKKMSKARELWYEKNPEKAKLKEQKRHKTFMERGLGVLEKNSAWLGGISFEPYGIEFNLRLKNLIRKRDNQICLNCGIHREKLKEALCVHHINYDKKCHIEQNLISLCRKCHIITNKNREYWTKLFQEKLSKFYNYRYSKKREIILNIVNHWR